MSLYEPKSAILTIKYYPENEALIENPPRFTWMPPGGDGLAYAIEISPDKEFKNNVIVRENIPYNFYTLDIPMDSGEYFWRYKTMEAPEEWSSARSFTVAGNLPKTPLPGKEDRYRAAVQSHPRLWLNSAQIKEFKKNLKQDANYCGFNDFYKNSVEPYLDKPFVKEPLPYPNNKRVISIWRGNYMQCQEALCYIRSFSVAAILLEDERLLEKAKSAILEIAGWDAKGPTSRDYNDECAFRVVYAIAFGYDWLYSSLTEEERTVVLESLFIRTKQVADHVIVDSRIHFALYDSHAVRSLSSVLTPCCIAMLFEKEEAMQWLDYTVEYLSAIYTPWGNADGGWAEGPMYWTTGMAFLIDALNLIKNYLGIDLYKRPFFQKTGGYILNCCPVDTYRASFCDQSSLGEPAGIKTAFNIRQFGAVSGNREYIWYFNRVMERSIMNPQDFFNKGWWDLYFDEMLFRHDYALPMGITEEKPSNDLTVKWFRDIGWVSINKNMADPDNHIFLLTKSSPYGSVSHSHGDQNSFLIFAFGEPLIIKSGYYVGFNSSMHVNWRRQTISHNTITIDGKGQYALMDKSKQLRAKGKVLEVLQKEDYVYIKEDATEAYAENVEYLKNYTREIYFVDEEYFVIVDNVSLDVEGTANFLLHSLSSFNIGGQNFHIRGTKADLRGKFIYCSSGIESITETDEFANVDLEEVKGLEKQYHLRMDTKKAKNHTIVTLLRPAKKNDNKPISAIKDDQGHDLFFYFDNDGKTFTLILDGNKRY